MRIIAKYESAAKNALVAGNEDDAKTLIAHKQTCVSKKAELEKTYAGGKAECRQDAPDARQAGIRHPETRIHKRIHQGKGFCGKSPGKRSHAMGNVNLSG